MTFCFQFVKNVLFDFGLYRFIVMCGCVHKKEIFTCNIMSMPLFTCFHSTFQPLSVRAAACIAPIACSGTSIDGRIRLVLAVRIIIGLYQQQLLIVTIVKIYIFCYFEINDWLFSRCCDIEILWVILLTLLC